jgi:hypothetical protein
MLNICFKIINDDLDMMFNAKKSYIVRVGKNCNHNCSPVKLSNDSIIYSKTVKYLGYDIISAKKFTLCINERRSAFYKALNLLLVRSKNKFDDIVMLHLVNNFCVPILIYGADIFVNSCYDSKINRTWCHMLWRIFKVNCECNQDICKYTGIINITDFITLNRKKFRNCLKFSDNLLMRFLYEVQDKFL